MSKSWLNRYLVLSAVAAVSFLFIASNSRAEDDKPSPDGFFSQDFVTKDTTPPDLGESYFNEPETQQTLPDGPAVTVEQPAEVELPKEPEMPNEPSVEIKKPLNPGSTISNLKSREDKGEAFNQRLSVIQQLKSSLKGNKNSKPKISLFVAAFPSTHLAQHVDQLSKLQRQYDMDIEAIYVVFESVKASALRQSGLLNKQAEPALEALHKSGVAVRAVTKVPEKFAAKASPLWVVSIDQEDHVFEGYRSPAAFFDRDGKFNPSRLKRR